MTPLWLSFLSPRWIKVLLNQLVDFILLRENKTLKELRNGVNILSRWIFVPGCSCLSHFSLWLYRQQPAQSQPDNLCGILPSCEQFWLIAKHRYGLVLMPAELFSCLFGYALLIWMLLSKFLQPWHKNIVSTLLYFLWPTCFKMCWLCVFKFLIGAVEIQKQSF